MKLSSEDQSIRLNDMVKTILETDIELSIFARSIPLLESRIVQMILDKMSLFQREKLGDSIKSAFVAGNIYHLQKGKNLPNVSKIS